MKAILAITSDYALGKDNGLPWDNQKSDLKHFRNYTYGKKCIVGRKTFEGLGKLPGRTFYVVTRSPDDYKNEEDVIYVKLENVPKDGIVIGGKEIYEQLIPHCEEVSVTVFEEENLEADTFFNPFPFIKGDIKDIYQLPVDENNKFSSEVLIFK